MLIKQIQSDDPDTMDSAGANVDGATLALGNCVAYDFDTPDVGSVLDTTPPQLGTGIRLPISTGNGELFNRCGIVVQPLGIPDGEIGIFRIWGYTPIITVNGTADIAVGDALIVQTATGIAVTTATPPTTTALAIAVIGIALTAFTTNADGTIECLARAWGI